MIGKGRKRIGPDGKPVRARDLIERYIADYCTTHGGNTPYFSEIEAALGMYHANVYQAYLALIAEGRIAQADGKFWLVGSTYHPPQRLEVPHE